MKYIIILFAFILLQVDASAQTSKVYIDSVAKSVITDLQGSWTLGINNNSETIDIRVYNKFKSLFDTAAVIADGINTYFQFNTATKRTMYAADTASKSFDLYAHDLALQVKSLDIDIHSIESNTSDPNVIIYTLTRKTVIQKTRQFVIQDAGTLVEKMSEGRSIEFERREDYNVMKQNFEAQIYNTRDAVYTFNAIDTLQVIMRYNDADSSCKIVAIKNVTPKTEMVCLNDNDSDGILNEDDSLPDIAGDFTANGKPDKDFDGIADVSTNNSKVDKCRDTYGTPLNQGCPMSYFSTNKAINAFLGIQQNSARINLPELNDLGYRDADGNNATDVLQSQKGLLQNPGSKTGIYGGFDFTYFFGKKMRTGISAGFTYSGFSAAYLLTEPMIYTYKASDGVDAYRRQIAINSLKEDIAYNIYNFPVLFNYRMHADKAGKTILNIKAGPSLMLFHNTSTYNATIDFGGLYQIDTITKDAIRYYDYYDPGSTWNVAVTTAGINAQNTDPGAAEVFSNLYTSSNGYDFASNKNYDSKQKLTRTTIAVNAAVDLSHKIGNGLAIKFSFHFVYAPSFERNEKYIPIDKTSDGYNSIYNSSAKSNYSAYGISAGITYDF